MGPEEISVLEKALELGGPTLALVVVLWRSFDSLQKAITTLTAAVGQLGTNLAVLDTRVEALEDRLAELKDDINPRRTSGT